MLNFVHVIVCDFGLANQVWKFLEFYAKYVFEAWEFKENCLRILILGKLGSKQVFLRISYSCILFIKYYALRSLCIKLLCFSKKIFFPQFQSIELVSRLIEIAIKSFGLALCVSIDWTYFSFNWKSYREFFKTFVFSHVLHYSNFFQTLSLSIRSVQDSYQDFCHFPPKFLQGFSPLRPVRPFYHSFCIYFHVSCIKSCILGRMSNQWVFGIFDDSTYFS